MIWSANQQIRITTEKHKIDLNLQVPSVLMINIYYETEQKVSGINSVERSQDGQTEKKHRLD